MSTSTLDDLSPAERHRALEVYARAVEDARVALSALMGVSVRVDAPRLSTMSLALADLSQTACATSFALSGGTAGTLVLASSVDDAAELAGRLLGAKPAVPLQGKARGAFDEIGNIVASQFLNVVASVLGVSCLPSVPYAHQGDTPALVASILSSHQEKPDEETIVSRFIVNDAANLTLVHAPADGATEALAHAASVLRSASV